MLGGGTSYWTTEPVNMIRSVEPRSIIFTVPVEFKKGVDFQAGVTFMLPPAYGVEREAPPPRTVEVIKEVIKEKPIYIYKKEVVPMTWNTWNVLVVVVICVLTVKVLIPRLTIRNAVRTSLRVVVWPFKRTWKVVKAEATTAARDAAAEERREEIRKQDPRG
jgi:hypothetical protein